MPMRHGPARRPTPSYFADAPGLQAVRRPGGVATVEVPNVPNSVEIWQTFRDAWTSSVIFDDEPIDKAFADAAARANELVGGGVSHDIGTRCDARADDRAATPEAETERWLGRQPIGLLFVAALRRSSWSASSPTRWCCRSVISSTTTSSPRPGPGRPALRRLQNYVDVLSDPTFQRSLPQRRRLPDHQRAADGGALAGAGPALNATIRGLYVLPRRLLRALRHGQRGGRRRSGCSCSARRPGQHRPRAAGARPVLAGQQLLGDADDRALRDLEAARLLHPALPRGAAEHPQGALRGRRRWTERARSRKFWSVTVPGVRPATTLVVILATITGANLFTEPYLLTNGGGPERRVDVTRCFLMYQKGIEQGQAGLRGGDRRDPAWSSC